MAKRHMTNQEKIQHMMRFSNHGALKQIFIMAAVEKYADMCIAATPDECGNQLINGEAWQAVAREVKKEMLTDMTINDPELDDEDEQDDFDPENIYGTASIAQSIAEDRK